MARRSEKLVIGRIVWYRSRTGAYTVPAVITCTRDSLYEPAVEAGYIPALDSPTHVHLTVFSPGIPQLGPNSDPLQERRVELPPGALSHNLGGCYQEWNVPQFEPPVDMALAPTPSPVNRFHAEQPGGTWAWPWRRG